MIDLPTGTVRRAPIGFCHAILLDQGDSEERWFLIDAYGPMPWENLYTDEQVRDWVTVYTPIEWVGSENG